jgi:ABC-type spermidine/putrescine transport system permease subunit II
MASKTIASVDDAPASAVSPAPRLGATPGVGAGESEGRNNRRLSARAWLPVPAVSLVAVGFILPLIVVLLYSFRPTVDGQVASSYTLDNYLRFFATDTYWQSLVRTVLFVGAASVVTVVVTFPLAYFVATKVSPRHRMLWVLLATIPFLTSYLIRVMAWLDLLGSTGLINNALTGLGIVDSPVKMLETGPVPIIITFTYLLFPLAFLTSFIALDRVNPAMYEAASDLGSSGWQRFRYMVLPLSANGIVGGLILSFIAMMGDYVTPQMVGGTAGTLYANLIINQFGNSMQWGFGSTLALLLLVTILLLLALLRALGGAPTLGATTGAYTKRRAPLLTGYAVVMLVFLYAPMALLALFAFNDAPTVGLPFKGFTTEWFSSLMNNGVLQDALVTSVRVALTATAISLVLGTAAAVYTSRATGTWRKVSITTISLPLVLPPVILGMAIIIALNAIGVERGLWTIILGHSIITLPLVTLIISIRLEGLDRNYELAAQDLGARPHTVFLKVVLPQIAPGVVAGAMIALATSLDEFIMTFLVTGTDNTLPLYIFGSLRYGLSPELTALATLILAVSLGLLIAGALIGLGRRTPRSTLRKAN